MGVSPSVTLVERRQLTVRFYSRWYYVKSVLGVSGGESGRPVADKQNNIFGSKNFVFYFF